jgi:hypothetical protein
MQPAHRQCNARSIASVSENKSLIFCLGSTSDKDCYFMKKYSLEKVLAKLMFLVNISLFCNTFLQEIQVLTISEHHPVHNNMNFLLKSYFSLQFHMKRFLNLEFHSS